MCHIGKNRERARNKKSRIGERFQIYAVYLINLKTNDITTRNNV